MKLFLCYGELLEQNFFEKYNVTEKSDCEEFCEARYNFLCDVLGNSSIFHEDDPDSCEDKSYKLFLNPQKLFVSEYGKIISGIVYSFFELDPMDGEHENYVSVNSDEDFVNLIVKAFSEYCGSELYSGFFYWNENMFIVLSDSSEETDKICNRIKKIHSEHKTR